MKPKNHKAIFPTDSPEKVAADLEPLLAFSEKGISAKRLTRLIQKGLIPHLVRYDRKEFQSLYNFYPEKGATFGAKIALNHNQGVTNWQVSPGGVMLEELCCKTLCRLFHLGPDADATFMTCGTYANQQALYLALHRRAERQGFDFGKTGLKGFKNPEKLAVMASVDAHFSLRHGVRMLGLGDESLIPLPVDKNRCLDMKQSEKIILRESKKRDIFCMVATAGTTSTGSVDPILPIRHGCDRIDAWLHVDGAYGLAFRLLPEYESLFSGLDQADSITWDPHKQFGVPIPSSLLFLRKKNDFERMAIYGEYFNRKEDTEPNPGLKSPPSTRPLSALPLVTSIRLQGMARVKKRLRAPVQTIKNLYKRINGDEEIECCHEPDTGILCIRSVPKGVPEDQLNNLQVHIYQKIKESGHRSISITKLGDDTALRLVAVSLAVTEKALLETIAEIKSLSRAFRQSLDKDS